MGMAWTDAREFLKAAQQLRRQRLLDMAVAARAAQAESKEWGRWAAEITSR